MAGLKVFVSSTCYDLSIVRSQLRLFIQNIGHEPVMSDYNDILYDHRIHTHSSCVDEVGTSDIVVLIVGSRYGGKNVPEALTKIDFEKLFTESKSLEIFKKKENLSVTQLEILKAVESGIPVFTFIDAGVWHDHSLYEKNKDKNFAVEIEYPSIQKQETASYIFEFINFLRHRAKGNSVFQFDKLQDIEEILRKQWSLLLQKLLTEQRMKSAAARRFEDLSEQFEDLKTAILTSIGSNKEKEVARGVVRYRRLVDFVKNARIDNISFLCTGKPTWDELLAKLKITAFIERSSLPSELSRFRPGIRATMYIIRDDDTFFEFRGAPEFIISLEQEWNSFIELSEETRSIIIDALNEMHGGMGLLRFHDESINYFINKVISEIHERDDEDREE